MFELMLALALIEPDDIGRFYAQAGPVVGQYATWEECDRARWAWFADLNRVPEGFADPPGVGDHGRRLIWTQFMPGSCDKVEPLA